MPPWVRYAQDQRMEESLARLEYLLECGQLGLVTGASGLGKSALLKRFLHALPPQQCQAVYCHLTHLPSSGMLKMVVTQLGEAPPWQERLYEQILERAARAEGALLLVFDEAHLLDSQALTDLRLLISSALDVGPPLKILLVGQEPLRTLLRRSQHADLANPGLGALSASAARGSRRSAISISNSAKPGATRGCSTNR